MIFVFVNLYKQFVKEMFVLKKKNSCFFYNADNKHMK